jgi:predicted nucleotidyltransferase
MRFRRWRSDAPVSLEEIAELLDAIARPFSDVSVVLYGSTVRERKVVGDIDVWIDGDAVTTARLARRIECLGRERGLPVDLVIAADPVMNVLLAEAVQWCVNRDGLAVAGRLPLQPVGVTYEVAERAYRHSIAQRAAEIAEQAEIYARAGLRLLPATVLDHVPVVEREDVDGGRRG